MIIDIQNLQNIYEQRAMKRKKIIIKCVKLLACVFVPPLISYILGCFVFADFHVTNWTQEGRVNTVFICVVLWLLSILPFCLT